MTNQIPSSYYKAAAEIMSDLPDVDFMNIVAVLFAHDTWIDRQNALVQPIPEQPAVQEHEPAEKTRLHRKHPVRAMIDGKQYVATNRYDLMLQLGIEQYYNELFHRGKKQAICAEAEGFAKKVESLLGVSCTEYVTYGFDGKLYHIILNNGIFQYEEEVK